MVGARAEPLGPVRLTSVRLLLLVILAGVLAACGDGDEDRLRGVTAGREVLKDLAYAAPEPADGQGHLLDLYLPERTGWAVPVVLWSHGSGWLEENGRDGADVVAARLNPLGIAVAGVAVRSSVNAQFPGQLYDIKAAIRFLKNDAELYGLDPDRFATMGESSGGWVAAMAAVTGDRPELEGDIGVVGPSSRVAAAVPLYPPTDFLQLDVEMADCASFNRTYGITQCQGDPRSPASLLVGCPIYTCPDKVEQAAPITYVTRESPPFLIMHGTDDQTVPYRQSELLLDALRRACADATLISVPGGQHADWERWLDGRVRTGGISATVTSGCQSRQEPLTANWDTVTEFLRRTIG